MMRKLSDLPDSNLILSDPAICNKLDIDGSDGFVVVSLDGESGDRGSECRPYGVRDLAAMLERRGDDLETILCPAGSVIRE